MSYGLLAFFIQHHSHSNFFHPYFPPVRRGGLFWWLWALKSNVVLLLWLQLAIKGYDFNLCWCCCKLWCKLNASHRWTYGVGLNKYLALVIQVWDGHWGPHWIYLTKHSKIKNKNMDHMRSKENMITCIWTFLGIWST
jgi:hypothetical protein